MTSHDPLHGVLMSWGDLTLLPLMSISFSPTYASRFHGFHLDGSGLGPRRPPGAVTHLVEPGLRSVDDGCPHVDDAKLAAGDAVTFPVQVLAVGQHVTALCGGAGGCTGPPHRARDAGARPEPQVEGQAGLWPLGRGSPSTPAILTQPPN